MLESLPPDVIEKVWSVLPERDQHTMRAVCVGLRAICAPLQTVLTLQIRFFTFASADFSPLQLFTAALPNLRVIRIRDTSGFVVACKKRRDGGGITVEVHGDDHGCRAYLDRAEPVDSADSCDYFTFSSLRGGIV